MEDAEIIDAFRKTGDHDLFRALVERHQERVFRLVASVLGPAYASEAEEVTQEVFLLVFRKLSTYRAEARFSTWLYRVAWNRAADYRRRARFQRPVLGESALASLAGPSDPHRELEVGLRRREVLAALENLPELYRTLIHLHYWLDCSLTEIEELTGVPPGTSKSYLARARRMMEMELTHG
jgi:RNA polymerase sigma-70 factor (ECF subfamily)